MLRAHVPHSQASYELELEIMCPDGAEAGDVITVTVDGDELELEIPEGVVAGETFSVRIE